MKTGFLKKRQTKYTAYASVYILVVVAVLGAINFLANRYNKSYDSTTNKQFSLSDQTVKVVKNLKQRRQAHLLRRELAFSAGARPAGPLPDPIAEAEDRLHRPGAQAAGGPRRRLPPRCAHPGG